LLSDSAIKGLTESMIRAIEELGRNGLKVARFVESPEPKPDHAL
jgi:hypothetical protein